MTLHLRCLVILQLHDDICCTLRSDWARLCLNSISTPSFKRFQPDLIWYIDECMVSIININNGIVEPTCGYQNCIASQIVIFSEYVKVRESLYTELLYESIPISTILIQGQFGLGMEVLAWYIDPNGIKNNTVKTPTPYWYQKI